MISIIFFIACLIIILFISCLKGSQAAVQIHPNEENFINLSSEFNKTTISEPLAIIASGTSGDCKWLIDGTQTLTIYGPGTLGEAKNSKSIWSPYAGKIKRINISNEVMCPANSSHLFSDLKNLTKINDLQNLKTGNVIDMSCMFMNCTKLTSLDLSSFDTHNVTDMNNMFNSCIGLKNLNLSNFDTSRVTDMSRMFYICKNLSSLNFSNFDTSQVTDMQYMFSYCSVLMSLDVTSFNTSKVNNMSGMFIGCRSLDSLNLSSLNTSNVTDMSSMFSNCEKLSSLDFSQFNNFDTSNVTNMSNMFSNCYLLANLDLSNFDTSNVTNMSNMFFNCSILTNLNINNFNTAKVTNMQYMFSRCLDLTDLDLNSFDTSNVRDMSAMFALSLKLWKVTLGTNFTFNNSDNPYPNTPTISDPWADNLKFTDENKAYIAKGTKGQEVKWQAVSTGTVHDPKGEAFISSDFPNIKKRGKAETYVWQHRLFNARPELSVDLSNQTYPHDYRSGILPSLIITGNINDKDSSKVSLYYAIDQEPTQDDAHKFADILINSSNLEGFSLNIEKQEELKTLAMPKQGGHNIQILAVDNGAQGNQTNAAPSEIAKVNIGENGIIDFQYLSDNNQKIKAPQTLVKAVNETSGQVNSYLPKVIWHNNERYNLNQEKVSQSMKDLINGGKMTSTYNETEGVLKVKLIYNSAGQVSLQIPQGLDFGKHVQPNIPKQFDLEQKPKEPLVVTDTTQDPNWVLCLTVTPFQITSTREIVNNSLLSFSYNGLNLSPNTETPIANYMDFNTIANDNGAHITNISNSWWDENDVQRRGPRLNVNPGNLTINDYSLTATWTVENSIL